MPRRPSRASSTRSRLRSAARPRRRPRRGRRRGAGLSAGPTTRLALRGAAWTGLALLPFVVLVRGALVAHTQLGLAAWPSVAIGLLGGGLALAGIAASLWRRWRGVGSRARRERRRRLLAVVLVPTLCAFGVYSLGWLTHANAKSERVSARWHELHPVLRLALGPVRLADPSVVVTEIGRRPRDYDRMGLRRAKRSPHYPQADGWVHAIDVRTRGRGVVRNALIHAWYAGMGFDTLRHAGTADHLHVALP